MQSIIFNCINYSARISELGCSQNQTRVRRWAAKVLRRGVNTVKTRNQWWMMKACGTCERASEETKTINEKLTEKAQEVFDQSLTRYNKTWGGVMFEPDDQYESHLPMGSERMAANLLVVKEDWDSVALIEGDLL